MFEELITKEVTREIQKAIKIIDTDLNGKKIYHGTEPKSLKSLLAGPKNIGRGFGGRGLYLALEAPKLAEEFSKGIILEGTLAFGNETKTIAKISIVRNSVETYKQSPKALIEQLKAGKFPADWHKIEPLRNWIEQNFDIIEVHGAKDAGLAIDSNRYLIIHERAGDKLIQFEKLHANKVGTLYKGTAVKAWHRYRYTQYLKKCVNLGWPLLRKAMQCIEISTHIQAEYKKLEDFNLRTENIKILAAGIYGSIKGFSHVSIESCLAPNPIGLLMLAATEGAKQITDEELNIPDEVVNEFDEAIRSTSDFMRKKELYSEFEIRHGWKLKAKWLRSAAPSTVVDKIFGPLRPSGRSDAIKALDDGVAELYEWLKKETNWGHFLERISALQYPRSANLKKRFSTKEPTLADSDIISRERLTQAFSEILAHAEGSESRELFIADIKKLADEITQKRPILAALERVKNCINNGMCKIDELLSVLKKENITPEINIILESMSAILKTHGVQQEEKKIISDMSIQIQKLAKQADLHISQVNINSIISGNGILEKKFLCELFDNLIYTTGQQYRQEQAIVSAFNHAIEKYKEFSNNTAILYNYHGIITRDLQEVSYALHKIGSGDMVTKIVGYLDTGLALTGIAKANPYVLAFCIASQIFKQGKQKRISHLQHKSDRLNEALNCVSSAHALSQRQAETHYQMVFELFHHTMQNQSLISDNMALYLMSEYSNVEEDRCNEIQRQLLDNERAEAYHRGKIDKNKNKGRDTIHHEGKLAAEKSNRAVLLDELRKSTRANNEVSKQSFIFTHNLQARSLRELSRKYRPSGNNWVSSLYVKYKTDGQIVEAKFGEDLDNSLKSACKNTSDPDEVKKKAKHEFLNSPTGKELGKEKVDTIIDEAFDSWLNEEKMKMTELAFLDSI